MQRTRVAGRGGARRCGPRLDRSGTGLLRGGRSFMVDDGRWAVIGAVAVTVGIVILIRDRRTRA